MEPAKRKRDREDSLEHCSSKTHGRDCPNVSGSTRQAFPHQVLRGLRLCERWNYMRPLREANSATTTGPSVGRAATKRDLARRKLLPASVLSALLASACRHE